jgi:hypothetical protein
MKILLQIKNTSNIIFILFANGFYIYEKMPKEIKIYFNFLPRALKTIKQQSGLLVLPCAKIRKKEN